jgi:hypothetical protein
MRTLEFWKIVTMDQTNFLERLIALLDKHGIRYCVVGGQAVNAYVEPLVSLDLDIVVAVEQVQEVEELLSKEFTLNRYAHSLNISSTGSDLRVQIQTDPRYSDFVRRAQPGSVLGMAMPVANLEDVLRGKVWALQDPERRGSKRQKDLADVARLIEAYPRLKDLVPEDIQERLL